MARKVSIDELSSATGASPDRIEWLVRIGILKPGAPGTYTPGDVFRVKMIESLLAAGFNAGQIESAVASFVLNLRHVDRYVLREPEEPSPRTFGEFVGDLGPEAGRMVPAIYHMFGLGAPDAGAHLPLDEERLLRAFLGAWELARDSDTPLRAARLAADGTRTATAGWADLLYEQVAGPARERWLRGEVDAYPPEAMDAAARIYGFLPEVTQWLIQRYLEQTVTAGIAESFEEVLAARGLGPPPEPVDPPAVAFIDITGYTTLTEERGDDAAVRVATALQRRADAVVGEYGGRVVKLLGDGAMLLFREPGSAVAAATDIVSALQRELGLDAHAGVHAGRVIERDRDVFGSTVNLAARVTGAAGPGDVLLTEAVARAARLEPTEIEALDPVALRGVAEPVRLFRFRGS